MGLRGRGAIVGGKTLQAPVAKAPWDKQGLSRAEKVIRFVESLTITSGAHAGRKFRLRPWQKVLIRAWYATNAKGKRIVRTGLLSIARKNGKTTLVAALALAHLVGPEAERRGQIVAAAADRDQAGLIFDELSAFIRDNPAYVARTNIQRFAKVIEELTTGTIFRVLSSDAAKTHGLSPSVVLVDELAQWGSTASGRRLYDALVTATGARAEPLTLVISTQSPDEHNLMTELVHYGEQILAGQVKAPAFSPHIFTVPIEADPWDETVWPLANPALGDFRSLEEMQEFAGRAQRIPSLAATFQAYYLNQRVDATAPWIAVTEWDACREPDPLWPPAGRQVYLGLDLASRQDIAALAAWFPEDPPGHYRLRVEFWVPEVAIEARAKADRVPYPEWRAAGWLHATPGNSIDYAFIEKRIDELMATYDVRRIGVDPWNARDLVTRLTEKNVPIVEVEQTKRELSDASKELVSLVTDRRLAHEGSPVMRWMIGNAVAKPDPEEKIKPEKKLSREKIDGVMAAVTGLRFAMIPEAGSIYETRGVIVLS